MLLKLKIAVDDIRERQIILPSEMSWCLNEQSDAFAV